MRIAELLTDDRGLPLLVGFCLAMCGLIIGLLAERATPARWLAAPIVALPVALVGAIAAIVTKALANDGHDDRWRSSIAVATALASGVASYVLARWKPHASRPDRIKRGAAIFPPSRRPWLRMRGARSAVTIRFVGHPVPRDDECRHFKVLGTTGTGKTHAIRALLRDALRRGDSAVVADPDGAYAAEFLDPDRGDRVLNPFDERSAQWDPFAEIAHSRDADHVARSLIPEASGEDRAWRVYARTFVAALLRRLHRAGPANTETLRRLLMSAPVEELTELLAESAAAPYLGADNARFFSSVRAIAATHCAVLDFVSDAACTRRLSVRRWVRETASGRPAVLFLTYRATHLASLGGAIAAWMRLAIFETMEVAVDGHRLWFIVDELDALGGVDGLKDALVRLRKYGGRCVLGFQSIAQVAATYGRHDAQTIVENCGNSLVLRCSSGGPDGTAQYASRLIGEREVMRAQVTEPSERWRGPSGKGRTVSWQAVTEPAVLAAELEQLPDREGFLKLASSRGWRRIRASDWG